MIVKSYLTLKFSHDTFCDHFLLAFSIKLYIYILKNYEISNLRGIKTA